MIIRDRQLPDSDDKVERFIDSFTPIRISALDHPLFFRNPSGLYRMFSMDRTSSESSPLWFIADPVLREAVYTSFKESNNRLNILNAYNRINDIKFTFTGEKFKVSNLYNRSDVALVIEYGDLNKEIQDILYGDGDEAVSAREAVFSWIRERINIFWQRAFDKNQSGVSLEELSVLLKLEFKDLQDEDPEIFGSFFKYLYPRGSVWEQKGEIEWFRVDDYLQGEKIVRGECNGVLRSSNNK